MRDRDIMEVSGQSQRLFVAVWLQQEWVEAAARLQESLRSLVPADGVRWVHPQRMHVTLAFLGEVSPRGRQQAISALRRALEDRPAFPVGWGNLGAFPNWRRPQVLWVGIGKGAAQLADLAARVRDALHQEGLWFDPKPFRAHITLARLARSLPPQVVRDLEKVSLPQPGEQWVSEALLVSSRLGPGGPHYREEVRVGLEGAGKE